MGRKKTAGKTADRVVLALSTEQATKLNSFLSGFLETESARENNPEIEKISARISKTLNKQKVLREFEKQGVTPSKEQIKRALEVVAEHGN